MLIILKNFIRQILPVICKTANQRTYIQQLTIFTIYNTMLKPYNHVMCINIVASGDSGIVCKLDSWVIEMHEMAVGYGEWIDSGPLINGLTFVELPPRLCEECATL